MDPADAAYWQSAFGLGMLYVLAGGHAGEHPHPRPRAAAHLPEGEVDPGFALIDLLGLRSALAGIPAMDVSEARRAAAELAREVGRAEMVVRRAQDAPGDRGTGGPVRLGPGPVLGLMLPA